MRRVVRAVKNLSSNFRFFVYPGGTRGYGIYRPDGVFSAPLVEEMAEQLPEDYAKTVSYPHYRALLRDESANEEWSWCELCPDAIIGVSRVNVQMHLRYSLTLSLIIQFTPNGSGFSLAGHWAVYLYAYKLVHGEGAEIPYPGVAKGYECSYSETSAGTLAKVAIHASLHPAQFKERIFNVADSGEPSTMRQKWPQIAGWFGLKGVAPLPHSTPADPKPSDFIKQHQNRLREAGAKGVEIWNAGQLDSYGYWLTFDRQLSLKRLRNAGFNEENRPEEGWWDAFERFKKAGMIG